MHRAKDKMLWADQGARVSYIRFYFLFFLSEMLRVRASMFVRLVLHEQTPYFLKFIKVMSAKNKRTDHIPAMWIWPRQATTATIPVNNMYVVCIMYIH